MRATVLTHEIMHLLGAALLAEASTLLGAVLTALRAVATRKAVTCAALYA